jgi:2-phospho-L-lactate guanylyltransferase
VLVPLKRLAVAKTRLMSLLSLEERVALMAAMLADVLGAVAETSGVTAVTLVSSEPSAPDLAAEHGVAAWHDEGLPWNEALKAATQAVVSEPAVAIVSADIPLVTPGDLEQLLGAAPGRALAVARAIDGGTNAVCLRPPGALTTCFGSPASARAHLELAREAGLHGVVVDRLGTALDLDVPVDVARFLALGGRTRTHRLLEEIRPFDAHAAVARPAVLT